MFTKRNTILCLLVAVASMAGAQSPPGASKLRKELDSLSKQLQDAYSVYYKPYDDAKTEEESAKIRLDPNKDPAKIFLPKFLELRKKVKNDLMVGPEVEGQIINLARGEKALIKKCLTNLSVRFVQSPVLHRQMYMFGQAMYMTDDKPEAIIPYLQKIRTTAKSREVQASAIYNMAEISGRSSTAATKKRALYTELSTKYTDTRYAKLGQASLYELDHLQVGMVAPDFEIEDENGVKWKLSDYRGKVIVLDFWGFW
jgi:AhpC/TSA family